MSKIYTSVDQLIGHTPLLELTNIEKKFGLKARLLAKQAEVAQETLGKMSQAQLDTIVSAVAAAFEAQAEPLAEQAVKETGFGNAGDKTVKNRP